MTSIIKTLFLPLGELSLSMKQEKMHGRVPFCPNFVGKHLLLKSKNLSFMPCMLESDDKLWIQIDPSLKFPISGLSYEIILGSLKNF